MGRRKKTSTNEASPDNSTDLNINSEITIKALKARNQQLAQALADALQDKAQKNKENNALQAEYFALNEKFAALQNTFSSVGESVKDCLPMLNQLVSMFTRVIQLTSAGPSITNLVSTPNRDRITQTVTPRIVNGHLLSHPTINLSRMVAADSHTDQEGDEETITNSQEESSLHVVIERNHMQDIVKRHVPAPGRRHCVNFNDNSEDSELSEDDDEAESEEEPEESNGESEKNDRLVTVTEEDEDGSQNSASYQTITNGTLSNYKEVRVQLEPLCHNQVNQTLVNGNETSNKDASADTSHLSQPVQNCTDQLNNSNLDMNGSDITVHYNRRLYVVSDSDDESCQSTGKKICFRRGNPFTESDSLVTFIASPASISSLIDNGLTEHSSKSATEKARADDDEKLSVMNGLGLHPSTPRIATSTPIGSNSTRTRLSRKLSNSSSPVSPVNMKRGSGDQKLARVVLEKMKIEKRLSGSPIKKIGDILDIVPMTKVADMRKLKRERSSNCARISSNQDMESSPIPKSKVKDEMLQCKRKKCSIKGKENEMSIREMKKSPRPQRSARPGVLREPSLMKKLRRSK